MKRLIPSVVLFLIAIACLVFAAGCVTAGDTQRAATAHETFDATREDIGRRLAAGEITPEQATAELSAAVKVLSEEMKAVAKDVEERTSGFDWTGLLQTALGSILAGGITYNRVNAVRDSRRRQRGEPILTPISSKTKPHDAA